MPCSKKPKTWGEVHRTEANIGGGRDDGRTNLCMRVDGRVGVVRWVAAGQARARAYMAFDVDVWKRVHF